MPQFPWYHYPANAEHIPFSDLFLDLYRQASFLAHAFACRITRSMTDSKACLEPQKAWLPIAQQPEPARLEDFMKLLGQRLSANTPPGLDHVLFTTVVKVMEIVDEQPRTVLAMVESAMQFSRENMARIPQRRGAFEVWQLSTERLEAQCLGRYVLRMDT